MRLFAALPVPEEVRVLALPAPPDGVRLVPAQRWHLTLAFYGDVVRPDRLVDRLREGVAGAPGLWLGIAGAEAFGSVVALRPSFPRAGDTLRLAALAASARRAGAAVHAPGVRPQERFRPHITIARVRGDRAAGRDYAEALAGVVAPAWLAAEVVLVRSILGPSPVHEVLARLPLGAA